MKKPRESLYPPDWLKVAGKDWHRMEIMLDNEDAEAAGYFLQQSIEKYIEEAKRLIEALSGKNW